MKPIHPVVSENKKQKPSEQQSYVDHYAPGRASQSISMIIIPPRLALINGAYFQFFIARIGFHPLNFNDKNEVKSSKWGY